MNQNLKLLATAAISLPLFGCLHTSGDSGKRHINSPSTMTMLTLIDETNAQDEFDKWTVGEKLNLEQLDSHKGPNSEGEKRIFAQCGMTQPKAFLPPTVFAFLAPTLGKLAGKLIDKGSTYVVNKIDDALTKELEKYTATYQAGVNDAFYRKSGGNLVLKSNCFRMSRIETIKEEGKEDRQELAMDFIGQFRLVDQDAIQVRPLRLFVKKPLAKSKDKKGAREFGISLSLKADATWRSAKKHGQSLNDALSVALATEKFKLDDDNTFYYKNYLKGVKGESGWNKSRYQKIIPHSPEGKSFAYLEVSVAEVGKAPWILKTLQKYVSGHKNDLTERLIAAAQKVNPLSATSEAAK